VGDNYTNNNNLQLSIITNKYHHFIVLVMKLLLMSEVVDEPPIHQVSHPASSRIINALIGWECPCPPNQT
jgi:hypothetical protein